MSNSWSFPTSPDVAARRAGGRRHYNRRRQTLALIRRTEVCELLDRFPLREWGTVSRIARLLGVSASTVCRDIKAMFPPAVLAALRRPIPRWVRPMPERG